MKLLKKIFEKGNCMKEINKQKPILVTGGTGYIASWIIKTLLEKGLDVRATVRDKSNGEKYKHLIDMQQKHLETLQYLKLTY